MGQATRRKALPCVARPRPSAPFTSQEGRRRLASAIRGGGGKGGGGHVVAGGWCARKPSGA